MYEVINAVLMPRHHPHRHIIYTSSYEPADWETDDHNNNNTTYYL